MSASVLHQILERSGFSPVTKEKYSLTIDRWIDFAGRDPSGWTRDKAQDWYDSLLAGGLKVQSVNIYLANLRYVSRWYATKTPGAVDFAVVQRQRGRKGQKRSDESPMLDEDEATSLLRACAGGKPADLRDLALLVVGIETGMRRMSLLGFHFESLGKHRGYPTAKVPIKGPGGEETFEVPLSDTVEIALAPWIAWLRKHKVRSGPLFRRLARREEVGDEALSPTGVNEIVEARGEAAGLRHINPHMLRHTFISWRTQAGLTPLEIAEITGHKPKVVTIEGARVSIGGMGTYFHHDVPKIRNATPAWLAALVRELTKGNP